MIHINSMTSQVYLQTEGHKIEKAETKTLNYVLKSIITN